MTTLYNTTPKKQIEGLDPKDIGILLPPDKYNTLRSLGYKKGNSINEMIYFLSEWEIKNRDEAIRVKIALKDKPNYYWGTLFKMIKELLEIRKNPELINNGK